ncbi:hypothetical protein Xsze_04393 [Xenorhabdus szentirmaii DSM 16338]|nr:hypothetical protein Xsze_04393 [Xenorhabdus szentirmaii DSM 16338]
MLSGLDVPLVLVQQGNTLDQRQVFHVVTAGAGFVGQEGQLAGVRIDHIQRFQQALGILVQGRQIVPLVLRQ